MVDNNNRGSAVAGSSQDPGTSSNQTTSTGESTRDYESMYKELEKRLGEQGQELGEYRKFFDNIAPILEKLDASPEMVQAIIDNKIDTSVAKAALEGRITVSDAQAVEEAHRQVKKEAGKEYTSMKPEDVAKLVEEKAMEIRKEFEEKTELNAFQARTQEFIQTTPDFTDFADEIDAWLDKHTEVTDIEVAYYAVKGQLSEKKAKELADVAAAERAKEVALNASGGSNTAMHVDENSPIVDQLIAGRGNPNVF